MEACTGVKALSTLGGLDGVKIGGDTSESPFKSATIYILESTCGMNTKSSISFDGKFMQRDFYLSLLMWGCRHLFLCNSIRIHFRKDGTMCEFLQYKYRWSIVSSTSDGNKAGWK